MNFASPYVFNNAAETDTYEVVSDEEFKEGMDLSDSGSDEESTEDVRGKTRMRMGRMDVPTGGLSTDSPKPSMLGKVIGMISSLSSGSDTTSSTAARPPPAVRCASSPQAQTQADSAPRSRSKKVSSRFHHWKSGGCKPSLKEVGKKSKQRVFRRADTNIVSIRFDTLKTPSAMHAGEVIMCSDCEAIMSHISCIEEDGPDKVWKCEFCGNRNLVEIEEEEKPTADDVTYLVEPALSTSVSGATGRDESIVIFCIDISGSMTITTEIPGRQQLRGSETLRRLRRENTLEGDQRLPSEMRNVTYISRLQAVQAAVDHQLGEMAREFPHRRVGLVTFSYEVDVIGDGTGEVVTVSGEKLLKQDELTKIGAELPCPKSIKETRSTLGEKVFRLEEGGSTALGPALVVALNMASQHPGSKVIICTDGKSNEGVGKVENLQDSDPDPEEFYESVAATASAKGVSISVVTIKGTDCKLIQLGKLADSTGGQVNIVDPLKLTEEFSNVLADRIIATSVVATFILHRELYIGKEENESSKERREIGNVRSNHEISFEYGVRKRKPKPVHKPNLDRISEVSASLEENPPSLPTTSDEGPSGSTSPGASSGGAAASESGNVAGDGSDAAADIPSELPFQLQITYADVDGTKALRVLTQKKPMTNDRNVAEREADLNVLGVHTERRASELALQGDYSGSRGVALMNQRLAWRSSRESDGDPGRRKVFRQAFSRVKTVENTVQAKQRQEVHTYGRTHSDDEEDFDEKELMGSSEMLGVLAGPPPRAPNINRLQTAKSASGDQPTKKLKKKIRSEEVDDEMAALMYESCASSTALVGKKQPDNKK